MKNNENNVSEAIPAPPNTLTVNGTITAYFPHRFQVTSYMRNMSNKELIILLSNREDLTELESFLVERLRG